MSLPDWISHEVDGTPVGKPLKWPGYHDRHPPSDDRTIVYIAGPMTG